MGLNTNCIKEETKYLFTARREHDYNHCIFSRVLHGDNCFFIIGNGAKKFQ
jgi:hypothetical protein